MNTKRLVELSREHGYGTDALGLYLAIQLRLKEIVTDPSFDPQEYDELLQESNRLASSSDPDEAGSVANFIRANTEDRAEREERLRNGRKRTEVKKERGGWAVVDERGRRIISLDFYDPNWRNHPYTYYFYTGFEGHTEYVENYAEWLRHPEDHDW